MNRVKVWTLQTREVIRTIQEEGRYQPDFSRSTYLTEIPSLRDLYNIVLDAFNEVNGTDVPGLIYGLLWSEGEEIYEFLDFAQFREKTVKSRGAIRSMWQKLKERDIRVLELSVDLTFNPLLIDINDFQFLMPPVMALPPYQEADAQRLVDNLYSGQVECSPLPSGLIQVHLPCIEKRDVVADYPVFDLKV